MTEEPSASNLPTPRMLSWARNSTLYRLSRRMMSQQELFDAITRKAKEKFEADDDLAAALSQAAVDFAKSIGALDDVNYAQVSARSAVRNGKSRRATAHKLASKGIDKDIAAAVLEETDDLVAAVVFARKRAFGPFRRVDLDDKRRIKELSSFARGGFRFEIGKQVLAMSREDAEEVLSRQP